MDRRIAMLAALGLAVLLAGTWFAIRFAGGGDAQFAGCTAGAVAGGQIGGPFTLVDETGTTVTSDEVIDRPSLVYFGYTFCPDVCPLDALRNADAEAILAERGVPIRDVFITVDPARDTPEVLSAFTDNFSDDMLGLTGSPEQVSAAAQAYRVLYSVNDDDPEYYTVNHSTFTFIVLPDHGFVDFVRREETPEAVADRMECIARAAG